MTKVGKKIIFFLVKMKSSFHRWSEGVTTVLTMTTLMASVNAALPKISYMKSIDIYLGKFIKGDRANFFFVKNVFI